MTRGRKRGFCGVLATQRLSKLHKDAAAEANNKLIGRSSLDVDMDRAGDELGFGKAERARLRTLEPGHFFAFGPALSTLLVEVVVGPVETTHPKPGQRAAPAAVARTKVKKVLDQLADLPREAEEEARTLADAKGRIRDLERKLTAAEKAVDPAGLRQRVATLERELAMAAEREAHPMIERIEVPALDTGVLIELRAHHDALFGVAETITNVARGIRVDAEKVLAAVQRVAAVPLAPARSTAPTRQPAPARTTERPGRRAEPPAGGLGRAERAILAVLEQHPDGCRAGRLTLLAGYRWSGGFRNSLSALRTAGLMEGGNGEVMRITPEGSAAAGQVDPLPRGRELVEYWLRHPSFGAAERAILGALVEAHPRGLGAEELARTTGYQWSGGFRNALSTLRTAGLLEGRNSEAMRASEHLFS